MTFGQRVALNVPALLLRLGLAFVFIYAGAGKLFYNDMPVRGEDAAWLANHGLLAKSKLPSVAIPEPPPIAPVEAEGDGEESNEEPAPGEVVPGTEEPTPESEGEDGVGDGADGVDEEEGDGADLTARRDASAGFVTIAVQQEGLEAGVDSDGEAAGAEEGLYTSDDFEGPVLVSRRMGLVLLMHHASERGDWPSQLSSAGMLGLLSWMAVLTEFVGGWLILLGFLTRFWALGLAGTMVVAMWLTQIAPSIGTDTAWLGFLPELQIGNPQTWTKAWQPLQFQLILGLAALGVFFAGPGKVSLDAMLFRRRVGDEKSGSGVAPGV